MRADDRVSELASFWDELVACQDDLAALLQLIAQRVAEVVGEAAVLTIVSADGEFLEPAAAYHADPEVLAFVREVLASSSFRVGEGTAGRVAAYRVPVVVNRIERESMDGLLHPSSGPFAQRYPIRALVIVPMVAGGELVGTLGAVRIESSEPYADEDVVAVSALAERAAVAIANARGQARELDAQEYAAIYRYSVDGVLFSAPDGQVFAANPAACEILMMTEAEICRCGRSGLLVGDDPATVDAVEERARTGRVRAEVPMRRGNGEVFPADLTSAIFSTTGGDVRAVVIFRDASVQVDRRDELEQQAKVSEERTKTVQGALEESDLMFRQLAASVDEGFLLRTSDPVRFIYVSPGFERITGVPPAAMIADPQHFFRLVHPEDRDLVAQSLRQASSGEEVMTEHRIVRDDGETRWIRARTRAVLSEHGATDRTAVTLSDITHDRAVAGELERARGAAETANRRKDEFLSRMSHELRTPLNAILGFSQLMTLEDGSLSEPDRRSVEHIERAGRHLLDLVNEVLDITQIEKGTLSLDIEDVDVDNALREAMELMAPLAASKPVSVSLFGSESGRALARVDQQRLTQVLINLLSNAIKYNRIGGKVEVTVSETSDGFVRIRVADSGHGLSRSELDQIYTPFERFGREDIEGTGLGLALTKQLVEAMSGRIEAMSEMGTGTSFTVALPAASPSRGDSLPG